METIRVLAMEEGRRELGERPDGVPENFFLKFTGLQGKFSTDHRRRRAKACLCWQRQKPQTSGKGILTEKFRHGQSSRGISGYGEPTGCGELCVNIIEAYYVSKHVPRLRSGFQRKSVPWPSPASWVSRGALPTVLRAPGLELAPGLRPWPAELAASMEQSFQAGWAEVQCGRAGAVLGRSLSPPWQVPDGRRTHFYAFPSAS